MIDSHALYHLSLNWLHIFLRYPVSCISVSLPQAWIQHSIISVSISDRPHGCLQPVLGLIKDLPRATGVWLTGGSNRHGLAGNLYDMFHFYLHCSFMFYSCVKKGKERKGPETKTFITFYQLMNRN